MTLSSARSTGHATDLIGLLRQVFDPEYPGVSIVDLGLVETAQVQPGPDGPEAHVGLIPTFSGCPALAMIKDDVESTVTRLSGMPCIVTWLPTPVWDSSRLTRHGRTQLADEFTVVLRNRDGSLRCPVCGSNDVADQSMAGPTRCRSIAWCDACRNAVEVLR